jgi:hypothetical protein
MADEQKTRRGRKPIPIEQHKRSVILSVVFSEDFGLKVKAEADKAGRTYSTFLRPFIEAGMDALAKQEVA